MSDADRDMERLLGSAGRLWRDGRSTSRVRLERSVFLRSRRPSFVLRAAASAAGFGALVIALWVVVAGLAPPTENTGVATLSPTPASVHSSPSPTAGRSPAASPSADASPAPSRMPAQVREGDGVVATGRIVAWDDMPPKLCASAPSLLMDDIVRCSPIHADVVVGEVTALPGWTPQPGGGVSDWLSVEGTWRERSIDVQSVTATTAPQRQLPVIDCETPTNGWPGEPPPTLEGEAKNVALMDLVEQQPDLYSGIAVAHIGGRGNERTFVVGTVADAGHAREQLSADYPYNLCVISVEFSAAELQQVADKLARPDGSWQTRVDAVLNRVVVELAVTDDEAVTILAPYREKVVVNPLVRPDVED
jgi:hypothetical protein